MQPRSQSRFPDLGNGSGNEVDINKLMRAYVLLGLSQFSVCIISLSFFFTKTRPKQPNLSKTTTIILQSDNYAYGTIWRL